MRVIFYGTPGFAIPSLTALVGEGFDVVAVVTRPDKATGRHRSKLEAPPVKRAALAEELPVLQPGHPKDPDFQATLRSLEPDIAVVVGYGHVLPKALLDLPKFGSVNVHASLLPKMRGAAPIERAILEGFEETGVTIMKMDEGLDTGPMLRQVPTKISPEETGGDLRNRLAELGALALIEALTLMDESGFQATPQNDAHATYAAKLTRDDEKIDFSQSALDVSRRIRAMDPEPGAFALHGKKDLKLFGFRSMGDGTGAAGEVLAIGETMTIACGDGVVEVAEVQPSGKQRMTVRAFANGRGIAVGDRLA